MDEFLLKVITQGDYFRCYHYIKLKSDDDDDNDDGFDINAKTPEGYSALVLIINQNTVYKANDSAEHRLKSIDRILSNPQFKYHNSTSYGYVSAFQHAVDLRDLAAMQAMIKHKEEKGINTAAGVFKVAGKWEMHLLYSHYVSAYVQSDLDYRGASSEDKTAFYKDMFLLAAMLPTLRAEAEAYHTKLLKENPGQAEKIQRLIGNADSKLKGMSTYDKADQHAVDVYNKLSLALELGVLREYPRIRELRVQRMADLSDKAIERRVQDYAARVPEAGREQFAFKMRKSEQERRPADIAEIEEGLRALNTSYSKR